MRKSTHFLKFISMALLLTLGVSELSYAAEVKSLPPAPVSLSPVEALLKNPSLLQVPPQFSTLSDTHRGNQDKLIIHIQDAHANYSGQMNLAKTLDSLMTQYRIDTVLVEGGFGDGTLTSIKSIAPASVWSRVAKTFLMEGKIAGEEYLNLTSDHPMRLLGMENQELYQKSLESYAVLASNRDEVLNHLKLVQRSLDKIKNKTYPLVLLEYEKNLDSDQASIQKLLRLLKIAGIDLNLYPNLAKLQLLHNKEKSTDSDLATAEQVSLLKTLSPEGLLEETQRAEDTAFAKLLQGNKKALTAKAIDRFIKLLATAYSIRMTSSDYEFYKMNVSDFPVYSYEGWINRRLFELGYAEDLIPASDIFENAASSLKAFYNSVNERDLAFVENAKKTFEENSTIVLIAGGYHTQHLKELFENEGWSYAVLTPVVTAETNQKKYEDILLEPLHQTDKLRAGSVTSSGARFAELRTAAARMAGTAEGARMATTERAQINSMIDYSTVTHTSPTLLDGSLFILKRFLFHATDEVYLFSITLFSGSVGILMIILKYAPFSIPKDDLVESQALKSQGTRLASGKAAREIPLAMLSVILVTFGVMYFYTSIVPSLQQISFIDQSEMLSDLFRADPQEGDLKNNLVILATALSYFLYIWSSASKVIRRLWPDPVHPTPKPSIKFDFILKSSDQVTWSAIFIALLLFAFPNQISHMAPGIMRSATAFFTYFILTSPIVFSFFAFRAVKFLARVYFPSTATPSKPTAPASPLQSVAQPSAPARPSGGARMAKVPAGMNENQPSKNKVRRSSLLTVLALSIALNLFFYIGLEFFLRDERYYIKPTILFHIVDLMLYKNTLFLLSSAFASTTYAIFFDRWLFHKKHLRPVRKTPHFQYSMTHLMGITTTIGVGLGVALSSPAYIEKLISLISSLALGTLKQVPVFFSITNTDILSFSLFTLLFLTPILPILFYRYLALNLVWLFKKMHLLITQKINPIPSSNTLPSQTTSKPTVGGARLATAVEFTTQLPPVHIPLAASLSPTNSLRGPRVTPTPARLAGRFITPAKIESLHNIDWQKVLRRNRPLLRELSASRGDIGRFYFELNGVDDDQLVNIRLSFSMNDAGGQTVVLSYYESTGEGLWVEVAQTTLTSQDVAEGRTLSRNRLGELRQKTAMTQAAVSEARRLLEAEVLAEEKMIDAATLLGIDLETPVVHVINTDFVNADFLETHLLSLMAKRDQGQVGYAHNFYVVRSSDPALLEHFRSLDDSARIQAMPDSWRPEVVFYGDRNASTRDSLETLVRQLGIQAGNIGFQHLHSTVQGVGEGSYYPIGLMILARSILQRLNVKTSFAVSAESLWPFMASLSGDALTEADWTVGNLELLTNFTDTEASKPVYILFGVRPQAVSLQTLLQLYQMNRSSLIAA